MLYCIQVDMRVPQDLAPESSLNFSINRPVLLLGPRASLGAASGGIFVASGAPRRALRSTALGGIRRAPTESAELRYATSPPL
jgi:hypothetical protein